MLGKGAYKTVWKAFDRDEGIEVAWNIISASKADIPQDLSQEIAILKTVRHPNIISFHDHWDRLDNSGNGVFPLAGENPSASNATGELVFITELMTSGTLRE